MSNYRKIEVDVGGGYTYAIRDFETGEKLVNIGVHSSALRNFLSEEQWLAYATDETNVFSVGKKQLEQFINEHSEE